jgi:hypothetical protein
LGEDEAFAIDFTDTFWQASTGFAGSVYIKDLTTPANDYDSSPTTASASVLTMTAPSLKMTRQANGLLAFQAHNLILWSEELDDAIWVKRGGAVTANQIAAPDGTTTGDLYVVDGTTGSHDIYQRPTFLAGVGYAQDFYVKYYNTQWVAINLRTGDAATRITYFDVLNGVIGTVGSGITATITALANGWYRCRCEHTVASGGAGSGFSQILTALADNSLMSVGNSTSGYYLWGAHLRRTPSVDTYLATTTTARYALPLEWDENGDPLGLLVEEARTELTLYNRDFTNAAWTKSNMTTAKTATGPDGVTNSASTLTATAGNATALQAITSTSAARTHLMSK